MKIEELIRAGQDVMRGNQDGRVLVRLPGGLRAVASANNGYGNLILELAEPDEKEQDA